MHRPEKNQLPPPSLDEVRASTVDISVIIVNYNVREFLEQALRSIERAASNLKVEVFVVDNNSIDGSVEMVKTRFPDVKLIANENNVGFSTANNQAIRVARGRYLFILNPDTILREDTLDILVSFMDAHPESGAVGCKILNPDGTFAPESRRSFPTPDVAFYRISGLSRLFPNSKRFGRYNLSYLSPDEATEVDALSGSSMVVRHEALLRPYGSAPATEGTDTHYPGAGLFDEAFFMYGEDLDWCYRIQQAGWKINYTPDTQIIHYKGESTKKGELRYVLLFYGAMLRFAQKHFKKRHSFLLRGLLRVGIVVRGSLQVLTNTIKRVAQPLTDLLLVSVAAALAGVARYALSTLPLPLLYFGLVTPIFAISVVAGIGILGGYSQPHKMRVLPVLLGSLLGFASVSTLSFFFQGIAFSRIALIAGLALAILFLGTTRLIGRRRQNSEHLLRRAVLVGNFDEASRLNQTLVDHPRPPLQLVGYLEAESDTPYTTDLSIPYLGGLRHLRDTVRLRGIDDVLFAASILSNQTIFSLIQQLQGLPVACKILHEDREHLIGQARIDALTAPAMIDAEQAFGRQRSTFARRAFEVTLASVGLMIHPFVLFAARLAGPESFSFALATRTRQLSRVLKGERALVGHRPEEAPLLPETWQLKTGIFTLTDMLPVHSRNPQEISNAYWLYARNQSMAFDLDVIIRCLNQLQESISRQR